MPPPPRRRVRFAARGLALPCAAAAALVALLALNNAPLRADGGSHLRVNDETGLIETLREPPSAHAVADADVDAHCARGDRAWCAARASQAARRAAPRSRALADPRPPPTTSRAPAHARTHTHHHHHQQTSPSARAYAAAAASARRAAYAPEPGLAVLFESYGGTRAASQALAAAAAAAPDDPVLWSELGNAHRAMGDATTAIACFEAAIRLQPHPDYYLNLGAERGARTASARSMERDRASGGDRETGREYAGGRRELRPGS